MTEHPRTPAIDGGVPYIVVGCTVKAKTLIKVIDRVYIWRSFGQISQ
jgi:hypothetical protein